MVEVSKDNFEQEVLSAKGLVMVDFWGPKCDKCLALMPEIEDISAHYTDVKFCKIDITGNRRLAISQKVLGLPAVLFYKDGEKIAEIGPDQAQAENIKEKLNMLGEVI